MKKEARITKDKRRRRVARIRNAIREHKLRLRLTVFASNRKFYAQIIDDIKGETVTAVNEKEIEALPQTKVLKAEMLGELLAKKALDKKVKEVVFDKGRYKYHGRIKAFAQAARKGGLSF